MNKKIFFLLLAVVIALCNFYISCKGKEDKPLNPNGDSELALLMRKMASHTESLKTSLYNKSGINSYPADFEKMLTATPTDSKLDRPLFTGFANGYLIKLKTFYDSPDSLQVKNYNMMVNSCINCHRNFCSGPLKRIKKMLI